MQAFLWAIQRETKYDLVLNYASKNNISIQNLFVCLKYLCNNVNKKGIRYISKMNNQIKNIFNRISENIVHNMAIQTQNV